MKIKITKSDIVFEIEGTFEECTNIIKEFDNKPTVPLYNPFELIGPKRPYTSPGTPGIPGTFITTEYYADIADMASFLANNQTSTNKPEDE